MTSIIQVSLQNLQFCSDCDKHCHEIDVKSHVPSDSRDNFRTSLQKVITRKNKNYINKTSQNVVFK
jgi:hypothetical protein